MTTSEKLRPEHLARLALVYVRQSTLDQVRHHHESRHRQYAMAEHARALGWTQVVVIDDDLGKSGASAAGRLGFQRLVTEVSLGRAGAVFGLEVSRLARNNRDWYQLLDLCALMDTLIVDAEGLYDPRQLNDRLLLGLKGTMSEAELGWIRQRAHAGLMAKARRGALVLGVPVGYVRPRDGQLEKHPDQRVQDAIALVFRTVLRVGSVRQALLWFRHESIPLPAVRPGAAWGEAVTWRLPVYNTLLHILQNPCYAGAYAFGRTHTRTQVIDGQAHTSRGHRRDPAEWLVLVRDHHEGYIAWETYERIQHLMADNAQMKGRMVRGAVRRGPSLLAGVLRCGHCGRRLHVAYSGSTGRVPRYSCRGAQLNHGAGSCLSFGGLRVDEAVEREVLRVVTPGAIEAALAAATQVDEVTAATRRALELELREARYEAERAQRQYDAVEPEHRLVAETLERRWNAALDRVRAVERRLAGLAAETPRPTSPDRGALVALAHELPAVWHDPAADIRTKKRIVRLLLEEIVATAVPDAPQLALILHWTGGAHTRLVVARNRRGQHRHCTDRAIVDVVRDLARRQPDGQIARVLNRLGYRTGAGNSWTQTRVASLRDRHEIPVYAPVAEGIGPLTLAQAARVLGVSPATVRRLVVTGRLPATQPVPHAPWAIDQAVLDTDAVRRAVDAVTHGRALPQPDLDPELPLTIPQT